MHAIYANYARIRDEKGVRDADVSKATNIPASTFTDWKKGKSKPKLEKIVKIAQYLEVPMETLITLTELLKEPSEEAEELTLKKVCEIYLCLGVEKNKEIEEAKKNIIDNPKKIGSEILLYQKMIEFENWMNKYKAIERNIAEMREQMMLHPEWFES